VARETRLGKLPPRYSFGLNPHEGTRFSKCPKCDRRTHPRKFVLFIHVDGTDPIALGKPADSAPDASSSSFIKTNWSRSWPSSSRGGTLP